MQMYYLCPKGHEVDPKDLVMDVPSDVESPANYYLCRKCDQPYSRAELAPGTQTFEEKRALGRAMNIQPLIRQLLIEIGEDPDREGLKETPRRVAQFWDEFINYRDGNMDTTFEALHADQMVVVSGIPTWSLCEHHLLPFSATVSVGYIPDAPDDNGKILGLSKIARVVHHCAHKLQTQEGLVDDVCCKLKELLGHPLGIAVVASGVHTCMTMRGIRTPGVMTTSKVTGVFKRQQEVREEFFALVKHGDTFGRW